jgi:hypothetical protein
MEFNGHSYGAAGAEAITKYRFVNADGTTANQDEKVSIADSGEATTGIAADTVASGETTNVFTDGVGYLEVDGSGTAIVAGDFLKPHTDSSGKGIKATANNDKYGAQALSPSTANGDVIRVIIGNGFIGA